MISGGFLVGFETSKTVPKSFTQLKPIVMAGGPDILLQKSRDDQLKNRLWKRAHKRS